MMLLVPVFQNNPVKPSLKSTVTKPQSDTQQYKTDSLNTCLNQVLCFGDSEK